MKETLEIRRENVTGTSFRIGERSIVTRGSNLVADFVHEADAQSYIDMQAVCREFVDWYDKPGECLDTDRGIIGDLAEKARSALSQSSSPEVE